MRMHITPEYSTIEPGRDAALHAVIRLESPTRRGNTGRSPVHLAMVIDRSGSMSGAKIEHARGAAVELMNALTRRDFLSVVTFSDQVNILVPHQPLTDKELFTYRIRGITTGGSTNLSGGWLRGMRELRGNRQEGHVHRVLLLTDGRANSGVTEAEQLKGIAGKYRDMHISTTTVGFGDDFDEDVLRGIAEAGGGHFYYVESPEYLSDAFRDEFGHLASLVGQNLELCINPAAGVEITGVMTGCPSRREAERALVELGDLHAGDFKEVVVRLSVSAQAAPKDGRLAEVVGRYDAVTGEMEMVEERGTVVAVPAGSSEPDEEVLSAVWLARGMELRREAMDALDGAAAPAEVARRLRDHAETPGEYLKPTRQLREEQAKLRELAECLQGDASESRRVRKQVAGEQFARGRGGRVSMPGTRQVEFEFGARNPEVLLDVVAGMERLMGQEGYDRAVVDRARIILRELGQNAIEHGCGGREDGVARAICVVAPYYVRIVVEDDGPGFDFDGTLERLGSRDPAAGKRGRGLIMVDGAADAVRHSPDGRRIEAVVRKEAMSVESRVPGVGECSFLGDVVVVTLGGDVDHENSSELNDFLAGLVEGGWHRFVIDLGNTAFMDSSGLSVFALLFEVQHKQGGAVVLARPNDTVSAAMRLVHIDRMFRIFDTVKEAVEYLG